MSAGTLKDDDKPSTPDSKTVLLVFATVGDTTWRLFIPSIGGTLLGLWADNAQDTAPIFTIIGIVVGSIIAIMLVRAQIKKVNN
jgi:hypothetical protein